MHSALARRVLAIKHRRIPELIATFPFHNALCKLADASRDLEDYVRGQRMKATHLDKLIPPARCVQLAVGV